MKQMWKGNHAIAEGALRGGLQFYAGYPITPQTEVLEYLSYRMSELDRIFVQAENEIAAISLVYGASATGLRSMTGSSGIAESDILITKSSFPISRTQSVT